MLRANVAPGRPVGFPYRRSVRLRCDLAWPMDVFPQFRELLSDQRRAGVPFDRAWDVAMASVRDREWEQALRVTSGAWRAAYDGLPAADERRAPVPMLV